jgi:hypothetical protein
MLGIQYLTSSVVTVVENSSHHPKVKGLSLVAASGTERIKWQKYLPQTFFK